MTHLHCLIPASSGDISRLSQYSLASIRLRIAPLIRVSEELCWKITIGEEIKETSKLVLVGKIGANNIETRSQGWINQISNSKRMGSKIFLDYTDHHLGFHSAMTGFYKAIMSEVDACIVPSASMASLLASKWSGPISIIEDPIEIEGQTPKTLAGKPITILWFGHSSNIQFLIDFLSVGFNDGDHFKLIVLSNDQGLHHFANSNLRSRASIEVNLGLWSLENMMKAANYADICIIPSDLTSQSKIGVSSNRLITALALGLPTAADDLPSYKEFSNYYCDLRSSDFRELLSHPLKFSDITQKSQAELIPRFSMNKIESDWKKFLLAQIL